MRCLDHALNFFAGCVLFLASFSCIRKMHLGIATYVVCSGKPLTEIVGFLLLLVANDANVHCLLYAAFDFPMTITWISII